VNAFSLKIFGNLMRHFTHTLLNRGAAYQHFQFFVFHCDWHFDSTRLERRLLYRTGIRMTSRAATLKLRVITIEAPNGISQED
jgi:hypothetical protein